MVERVGVEADEEVGALENRPELRQIFLQIRRIGIGRGVVDADDGEFLLVRIHAAAGEVGRDSLDVENNEAQATSV